MKINQNLDNQIYDLYVNKGLNTVQIASIIGCNNTTVGRHLQKHNVNVNSIGYQRKRKLTLDDEQHICDLYLKDYTTTEIGKMYDVADKTIARVLNRNNVALRKSVRRSIIKNHDFFKDINTAEKAYFLGWMISDGAIIENKTRENRSKTISLEIHQKDIEILNKFKVALDGKDDIVKLENNRPHCYIRFASETMANDLKLLGVVPRKSHISYLPDIESSLFPHLLRGIFDGDGTIYFMDQQYPRFAFYGSYEVCSCINKYLHENISTNLNKIVKRDGCYMVSYAGYKFSKKFYNLIYNNCDNLFLTRKKETFEYIFKQKREYANTEITLLIA